MTIEHRHPRCATSCYVMPGSAPSPDATDEQRRELTARDQRIAELERELGERAAGGRP
jgi:hypothetical protein